MSPFGRLGSGTGSVSSLGQIYSLTFETPIKNHIKTLLREAKLCTFRSASFFWYVKMNVWSFLCFAKQVKGVYCLVQELVQKYMYIIHYTLYNIQIPSTLSSSSLKINLTSSSQLASLLPKAKNKHFLKKGQLKCHFKL